jgi:capsid protein
MQIDPKFPIEAAHEFKNDNLRAGAVGAGVAYQSISGDFQNLGFSASRMSELPQRDNAKVRQEHMIMNFVRLHFNAWLKNAILAGLRTASGALLDIARLEEFQQAAAFQGRRWAYVNPLQDEQAAIMAEEAGYVSPQQIQAEREDGQPLDVLYSEIEEAKALQEAHGLDFSEQDVTQPTVEKAPVDPDKPEPTEDGAPPAKKGGKVTIKSRKRRNRISLAELVRMQGDGRNGNH